MDNKLLARLQKLLALAKDARGNENEASAAMEKVQTLLAEHNLSIADLESKGQGTAQDALRVREQKSSNAMYEYQRELMHAVAEAQYCTHWISETGAYKGGRWMKTQHHMIIGREVNVVAAKLMFDYLNTTINRIAAERFVNTQLLSKASISYKHGISYRLCERLQERRKEMDKRQADAAAAEKAKRESAGTPTGTSIVLSDVRSNEADLNNDFKYGYEPGTTALRRKTNEAKWAAEAAQEAADEAARLAGMTDKERAAEAAKQEKEAAEAAKRNAKRNAKYWEKHERENQRKWGSKDMTQFWDGHKKGDDIGLDDQVGQSTVRKIG